MIPMLGMLEHRNLSLRDAEAAGFDELSQAAQRCRRCREATACIRWLEWRGAGGAPECLNAEYFDWLQRLSRPASRART
jgi:hypothetical protein